MNPQAMEPFGNALAAYFRGDETAELIIRRDDGLQTPLPIAHFFREPADFSAIEKAALDYCTAPVLDVGAGTGLHSLELQQRGISVTAMDVNLHAVDIMKQRGVKDVRFGDIFQFDETPFRTLLMLGHGLGIVGTVSGLDRFLVHARELISSEGQILLDTLDVRVTELPANIDYHQENEKAGRYIGEIRMQFEFQGAHSPFFGWLHVDENTLAAHARQHGYDCEIIRREESGEYLAALSKQ